MPSVTFHPACNQQEQEEQDNDSQQESTTLQRKRPNILVTGTPGVGKTSTASRIAQELNLTHINVGEVIQQNKCYDGYDSELQTQILDEDALLDILEPLVTGSCSSEEQEGGRILDYHSCELFPQRWFDLVLVLRADTHVLYDRLTLRGYSARKREENMECEIMGVLAEEARCSYDPEIVQEVQSNDLDNLQDTVQRVKLWYDQWMQDHGQVE